MGAFVIPLLTVYLMGVFTPVHRKSGTIGLLAGVAYGALRLVAAKLATSAGILILPAPLIDSFAAYPLSMLFTAGAMVLVSLALGFEPAAQRIPSTTKFDPRDPTRSSVSVAPDDSAGRSALPAVLSLVVVGLGLWLSFVVFW